MKKFLCSVYAGICIGLGTYVYVLCENRILGAFIFCIGIYSVATFRLELFTAEAACIDGWKRPLRLSRILVGNAVGACLFGAFASFNPTAPPTARTLIETRISAPLQETAVSGIICGILIALALKGYEEAEENGKFLIVVLGATALVVSGGEHVFSDVFTAATAYSAETIGTAGGLWKHLAIVLGFNVVGGLAFAFVDAGRERMLRRK